MSQPTRRHVSYPAAGHFPQEVVQAGGGFATPPVPPLTWHDTTAQTEHGTDASQLMSRAGLDWTVEKAKARDNYAQQNDCRLMFKPAGGRSVCLGQVEKQYVPLQNAVAFEIFNSILEKLNGHIDRAGSYDGGRRVWIQGRLRREDQVAGSDVIQPYLLLSNKHVGGDVELTLTPLRLSCANMLSVIYNKEDGQRFVHDDTLLTRLSDTEAICEKLEFQLSQNLDIYREMARTPMNGPALSRYFGHVFQAQAEELGGIDEMMMRFRRRLSERLRAQQTRERHLARVQYVRQMKTKREPPSGDAGDLARLRRPETPDGGSLSASVDEMIGKTHELFEAGRGNQLPSVRGSLWAAYNAVTELVDHVLPGGSPGLSGGTHTVEQRFESISFGSGREIKVRALRVAVRMMRQGLVQEENPGGRIEIQHGSWARSAVTEVRPAETICTETCGV